MKILVIGESCVDIYQYGDSVRLCPEAPVPVFNSNGVRNTNGGMAMNVYNNIKSLIDEDGITVDIHTNLDWEKITKKRYVDFRTNYIVVRVDENENLYGSCLTRTIDFDQYDVVVISDYNKGFLSPADIQYISKQPPITFLDTKKILGEWCDSVNYIKINDVEYGKTAHSVTEKLKNKMIITMGPDGCEFLGERYPVPKVEIKDAAGAGDTFIAALAVEYVRSRSLNKAIVYANECATRVVQLKGVGTA
tara:strand:+ start:5332 stop:6078 length:747 start_codon:yes stop_codon:yes gene_type:complete